MGLLSSTNGELVTRVRSNINEPSTITTPLRTDAEIIQWINEAVMNYLHRVPQEHFPELTATKTFSGSVCGLPTDYLFFHSCTVTHTLSGTFVATDDCFVLPIGDSYIPTYYPSVLGAYCQITGSTMTCGPNIISGLLTYVKHPQASTSSGSNFDLGTEHEMPIVVYATGMALLKVNDADSATWLERYNDIIEAMGGRPEAKEVERA